MTLAMTNGYFIFFLEDALFAVLLVCSLKVVKICRECVEKQQNVLADTHIYQLKTWSTLSEVLSYLQFSEEAATYACKMVDGYM